MLEDAYNEIQKLVDSSEKIHFIAFTKGGDLMISTSECITPLTFENITELLEYIETL